MQIEIDDRSGFCFGVVRAIKIAEANLPLVSLGDIVHNSAEVARLAGLGLVSVAENTRLEDFARQSDCAGRRAVLIRAHGEPPETYRKAREEGIELVDATCPVVARLQQTTREAFEWARQRDGQVVIFGKKGHAEIRGLVGRCEGNGKAVVVVETQADLEQVDFGRSIFFLAQTTSSLTEFERLGEIIRRRAAETGIESDKVVVRDTVCRQVSGREKHLAEFARRMDVVIFVAGAKSSNGRVLFEAVRAANPNSHKIESAAELRPEWFAGKSVEGAGSAGVSVGICGATSTPKWLMEEIATAISTKNEK